MVPSSDAERASQEATRLQERLAAESVDPDWAKRAEDALAESMSDVALEGAVMVDSWCASTLCRSEFLAEDPDSRTELLRALPRLAPWPADGFFHLDPDDDLRVITYLTREGYPLAPEETQWPAAPGRATGHAPASPEQRYRKAPCVWVA